MFDDPDLNRKGKMPGRREMNPALIITHLRDRQSGLVRETLNAAGCAVRELHAFDSVSLPSLEEVAALVLLGGKMSVTELERHPFLVAEVALLRAALQQCVPILGICLGAQLLTLAAGGRVSSMGRVYVGWPELSLTDAAREDPVFLGLPNGLSVLKWHEDRIDVPAGATLLGTTATPGSALFRVGPVAWGSQMHLETTPGMLLDGWLTDPHEVAEIESAGHRIADFWALSTRRLPVQMAAMRPAFWRFGRLVSGTLDARKPAHCDRFDLPSRGRPSTQSPLIERPRC